MSVESCHTAEPAAAACAQVLVSVIVPCFNAQETVDATIDAILRNRRPNIDVEIIAIDDGSGDATLQRLRARSDAVHVIALASNHGVSCARNLAIDQARGEFVAFCDADDIWADDKLSRQLVLFDDPQVGLVCASGMNFARAPGDLGPQSWSSRMKRGRVYEDLLSRNFIGTSTTVVRRAALRDHRFDTGLRHAEDFDLWLRIARDWKVDFVDAPLIHYRLSPSQASSNWVAMHESRLGIIRRHLALPPRPRRRRHILSRAMFAYAMEHWDTRDFAGARRKLARVVWLQPLDGHAWIRLLTTFIPGPALRQLLSFKSSRRSKGA